MALLPIHCTLRLLWFGVGFVFQGKPPWFLSILGSKSTKIITWHKSSSGLLNLGARPILGIGSGFFSKIQLLPTRLEKSRTGVEFIFPVSSSRVNGPHIVQTWTLWIFLSGPFWRPGLVLNPTKVWIHSSKPFSANGIKSRCRSCVPSAKISPSVWKHAFVRRAGTSKIIDCISSLMSFLLFAACLIFLSIF